MHVLIVEDEPSIADALVHALESESFSSQWVALGKQALEALSSDASPLPDLIILDVGLPDINGFDLCRQIKAGCDIPIIFLTARQEEIDKLIGLEIGGDDYVTKPFSLREVVSRVKVILRRYQRSNETPEDRSQDTTAGPANCQIDDQKKQVLYFEQLLDLTRYEYRLLKTLAEQPNRVFSRDHLMQAVWEDPDSSFERAVDTHIKTLRKKMRDINAAAKPIKTHHGLGYSFSDAALEPTAT